MNRLVPESLEEAYVRVGDIARIQEGAPYPGYGWPDGALIALAQVVESQSARIAALEERAVLRGADEGAQP